jgi:CHAT domain-containing protein
MARLTPFQKQSGRDRPKVTWVPVGPFTFIPVHAAGTFDRDGDCCSDYLVSSYCPTVGTLIKARSGIRPVLSKDAQVLVVAEPDAPGMPPLPNTTKEKDLITRIIPPDAYIRSQDREEALTIADVLHLLPKACILHLACHGQQDASNPLMSGFCLSDGKLTIAKIMQQNTPDAIFAFLSACDTAKGDCTQTDQSIYLATAMLFAGFKSVIGTMWYVVQFSKLYYMVLTIAIGRWAM